MAWSAVKADGCLNVDSPIFSDTIRDTLSAIFAGLAVMAISAWIAHRRTTEKRIGLLEKWRERVVGYFKAKGVDL